MQGLHEFIPTHEKVSFINQLMKVGYDTIDCGSFVSPKAIPQMADTSEVLDKIEVINNPDKYKDKKGFHMYHSHQKLKKHHEELCVTDSIGGCGMQQFYGWSGNSNYEISVELINYYLKHKAYGVGLVICQLGQDYFNGPFEKALIACGFKVTDEY